LHVCLVETAVLAPGLEYSRAFGRGAVVDLNESVGPGIELVDLVRRDCFAPMRPTESEADE
jgi:hypothetical protein